MTAPEVVAVVPQVGQAVQYFGSLGQPQAATILLTAAEWDSARARYDQRPLEGSEVVLKVEARSSNRPYIRTHVPLEGSPEHAKLVAGIATVTEAAEEDGFSAADVPLLNIPGAAVRFYRLVPSPYQV